MRGRSRKKRYRGTVARATDQSAGDLKAQPGGAQIGQGAGLSECQNRREGNLNQATRVKLGGGGRCQRNGSGWPRKRTRIRQSILNMDRGGCGGNQRRIAKGALRTTRELVRGPVSGLLRRAAVTACAKRAGNVREQASEEARPNDENYRKSSHGNAIESSLRPPNAGTTRPMCRQPEHSFGPNRSEIVPGTSVKGTFLGFFDPHT